MKKPYKKVKEGWTSTIEIARGLAVHTIEPSLRFTPMLLSSPLEIVLGGVFPSVENSDLHLLNLVGGPTTLAN